MEMGIAQLTRSVAIFCALMCGMYTTSAFGGGFNGGFNRAVGGVMIDASGMVRTATVDEKIDLANVMRGVVDTADGDLAKPAEMRMVSLKRLQQAIVDNRGSGKALPDSVAFLAGLQRIEFVFVDQANQDIVIAGPAEPWKLLDDGSVVGTKSGHAVLRLEDLVVAMQAVEKARTEGISCSIEPTAEGRRRLRQVLKGIVLRNGQSPAIYEESLKQAFGPQMISISGVPGDSRFARTLVAADYEMKRLAMELNESPVKALPSYLQMAKNRRHNSAQNPRWWMACNYDALSRSEDKTAWRLNGQGVKTMTEQDIVSTDGSVKESGRTDKVAQAWADKMTETYGELSNRMPIFADLRNLMDLTVVATLIVQEDLAKRADADLSVLMDNEDDVELVKYSTPKSVAPQCSFVYGRGGWIVTASGGVDVNGFEVVQNQETDSAVADSRTKALAASGDSWWWNK